ncbi:hypothetical protein ACWIFK_33585 [Streptomyces althioticus]
MDQGPLERRTCREPGERARDEYVLTGAGRSLFLIIAVLADWGRTHRPRPGGTSPLLLAGRVGHGVRCGRLYTARPGGRN